MYTRLLIVLSLVAVLLFLYGAIVNIGYIEENRCRMTYMFEHPQYTRIPVRGGERFPKYALYAYSEGYITQRVQQRHFTGAPVLFVPGSGGSFKQVRSLASVALRKGIDNNWQAHLDYFSVDLNEELSGVYGGYLQDQTDFLELCIQEIVRLYGARGARMFLVGHSVGGKLAQAVVALGGNGKRIERHVAGIVTISAPMDKPVALLDHYHQSFYDRIEQAWRANRSIAVPGATVPSPGGRPLDGILLVTIGGGIRDIIVHDGLTASRYADLHAMTHNIPNVWLSVDHLCAMWCLQFVLVTNRFLYSMIVAQQQQGRNSYAFVEDKRTMIAQANRFLAQPFSGHDGKENPEYIAHQPEQEEWVEDIRRSFTEQHRTGLTRTRVQMIRLIPDKPQHRFLRVEVINAEQEDDWLSGCAALDVYENSRFCQRSVSLVNHTLPVPSSKFDRSGALLDLHELKQRNPRWTHVLVKLRRTFKPVQFSVDVFNPAEREIHVAMPRWFDYRKRTILQHASTDDSFYRLKVRGMIHTYQTIALDLQAIRCDAVKGSVVVKVHVPWANGYDRYAYHEELNGTTVYIYPPIESPVLAGGGKEEALIEVDIHLTPGCSYRIDYRQSLRVSIARMVQQYLVVIPAHCVALLLLAFHDQLTQTDPEAPAFVVGKLRSSLTKPTALVVLLGVTSLLGKFLPLFKSIPPIEALSTPLTVSIVIHLVATGLLLVTTLALWGSIAFCANFAHKIILRLIALPIPIMSSTFLSCIHRFPLAMAVLLIAIALTACGGVSMLCAAAVYFVLLSKAYEDYLENFVFHTARRIAVRLFGAIAGERREADNERRRRRKRRTAANETGDELMVINFHLPLFFLVLVLAVLNVPSVITWAKNYHHANTLQPDPSLVPALVVLVCLAVLWQLNTPRNVRGYEVLAALLVIMAFVAVLYCQVYVYRLNYAVVIVFVAITLHQIIAPKRTANEEQEEPAGDGEE
uniref:GPI inositol-deacylase n=1 Tax=Anopheles marajoara TaxID=58244 RepID=A0A2M4BCA0_9DIPT